MIAVTASLRAKEGKREELEAVLVSLSEKVRANEPDCALYQVARCKSEPDLLLVMERYRDEAALAAHSNSGHFKAAIPSMMGCLEGTPDIVIYDEIG